MGWLKIQELKKTAYDSVNMQELNITVLRMSDFKLEDLKIVLLKTRPKIDASDWQRAEMGNIMERQFSVAISRKSDSSSSVNF